MAHHLASTETAKPETRRRGQAMLPAGVVHAVKNGSSDTVCGLDVLSLYDFPASRWEGEPGGSLCPECERAAPPNPR